MKKISLESNIWKFYFVNLLTLRFITPIRIIYLASFGLTFSEIAMMELAASIVILILEIPTGIFADIIGRKASKIIATALSIIAFSCLGFGSSANIFIIGWAISGAADAFDSGANDALIFDTLKTLNRESFYLKLKSHFAIIRTFSIIIGSIVGSILYTIDRRIPFYLVIISLCISTIIYFTIYEPPRVSTGKKLIEQLNMYKKSFALSITNIDVVKLIILGLVLGIPMYVFTTLLNQPYLLSRGFTIESMGLVFALIAGISGAITWFSTRIEKKLKRRASFLLISISFTTLLITMGLIQNVGVLVLIILFYFIDNFKGIIIDNYINQSIDSESRATVLSVQSFVNNISISLCFVFIGAIVDRYSIDIVLISMGIVIGLLCIPFLTMSNRIKKVKLK